MLDSLIAPFRRMFDFRGRSRRRDYWLFAVWQLSIMVAAVIIAGIVLGSAGMLILAPDLMIWGLLAYVAIFGLPTLALQVRRMHDADASGWWVLVGLIPYLGLGWLIYLMCQTGTWGDNRYGPDPRHRWEGDLFE